MPSRILTALPVVSAASLAVLGCDTILGDGYDVRIKTDEAEYFTTTATTIQMSAENRSDAVVYYLCGGEFYIERFIDGDLDDTIGALPNCECLCPHPIESGATREQDIPLSESVLEWVYEPFDVDGNLDFDPAKVTYRVRFSLYEDTEFKHRLDADDERSNEFKLRFPTR